MGNGKTRQMRWKKNYEQLSDPDAPKKDDKEKEGTP